jgi:arginine decarboxylase
VPRPTRPAHRGRANIAIQSVHKSGAGLAQTSLLHGREGFVRGAVVTAAVDLVETASPAVPLLASIDGWRRHMALEGEGGMGRTIALSRRLRCAVNEMDGFTVRGEEVLALPGAHALDPTKVVIDIAASGVTGYTAWDWLNAERHTLVELEDDRRLVPLTTTADDQSSIDRLIAAMADLSRWAMDQPRADLHLPRSSVLSTALRIRPRDAYFSPTKVVPDRGGAGRISAGQASPCPPGVPAVCAAEEITPAIVEYLRRVAR